MATVQAIEAQLALRHKIRRERVSQVEYEVLIDIALGLTDNLIAQRRYLSRRGVQNRLQSLYSKLGVEQEKLVDSLSGEGINMRARAVAIALHRGLINAFELKQDEQCFRFGWKISNSCSVECKFDVIQNLRGGNSECWNLLLFLSICWFP